MGDERDGWGMAWKGMGSVRGVMGKMDGVWHTWGRGIEGNGDRKGRKEKHR